ncbi:MAG: aminoacyl-histidine dipeptidase [Bacteroidales bacterium]
MEPLKGLKPEAVWNYFGEICNIPRRSTKEEKIVEYLVNFGHEHNLETIKDEVGNVVIRKAAAKGFEGRKCVCLQSHVDMVAEKNSDSSHHFDTDAIQIVHDNGWIKAKDTTLGADNGVGIASQLAILADKDAKHGPLECLFTVEEELGLKGAFNLKPGFINSSILLNLDSEDEGEIFIGCAGGIDTIANMHYKTRPVPSNSVAFRIDVSGLTGGHSGDDINKNRGNSIKTLNRFLWTVSKRVPIRLAHFEGGNLRNAIPRESTATITTHKNNSQRFKDEFSQFNLAVKNEMLNGEPGLNIELKEVPLPLYILRRKYHRRLFNMLYGCPNGVIAMSRMIDNLVETSTNLASVKFINHYTVSIATSQRSSVDSAKMNIANTVSSIFDLGKADVEHSTGYPGWEPNPESEILKIASATYKSLYGIEPKVKAIHAGLECGLFLQKYPHLDMISFGPTIRNAHSPDERVDIGSVQKYWDHLLAILQQVPEEN